MFDRLVVLDGSTFFVSDRAGDVSGDEDHGFFFADARHLSEWRLLVDGDPIRVLTTSNVDYYSAQVLATLAAARVGVNPSVSVQRHRIVADGVHEDVFVENNSAERSRVSVEVCYSSDFADLFEVKDRLPKRGSLRTEVDRDTVTLWYENGSFRRATKLRFSVAGEIDDRRARFEVELGPRERWGLCIDVTCIADGQEHGPRCGHGGFGQLQPHMPLSLDEWVADAPRLITDDDTIRHTYDRSLLDLAALRFRPFPGMEASLPAAGLPWFMALFGRDSLITAYMALPFQPRLAAATLKALAAMQATGDDAFRDAEPGKILHELRRG